MSTQMRIVGGRETNGDDPSLAEDSPARYLNRELTWLTFNRRVLNEARDTRNPLLERIKFVAILASNLDEFFMKRIGGLLQQVGAGVTNLTDDGRSPQQQIDESADVVRQIETERDELWLELRRELAENDIEIIDFEKLTETEAADLREHFVENVFPLLTPQAIDPAHPFPFISNLALNLFVTLHYPDDPDARHARVKVPIGDGVPRFLAVGDGHRYLPMEQLIEHNLDLLFPGMEILASHVFHVTRNANTERSEDSADDLLELIETEVRDRKFAPIVRVVVEEGLEPERTALLASELGLGAQDVYVSHAGLLDMADLWQIALLDVPELRDAPHHPIDHPRLIDAPNVFRAIRESDGGILLHHPYESFSTSVVRLLEEAGRDPKVRAIKMTLYRTSEDTKVVDYLIAAASNGKQVAVVVELKARFDEAANIRWASRLEEAGIHVTYGVVGLKTHCKVILVVRHEDEGLRRYAHVGTGNYHAGTARLYTDYGLLTCDPDICSDLSELFNYLTTGYTPKRNYRKILPAPKQMKKALLNKIDREVEHVEAGREALIQFQINALEDVDVVRALYRASQAGVKVELIVRDTCRLRPGIEGLSDNVSVVSIVGRFLEHRRVYYFLNGGEEEYYIGSADAMRRNLEARVEVLVPIEEPRLREELREILDLHLADRRLAWDMRSDGSYDQRQPVDEEEAAGAQMAMIDRYEAVQKEQKRLKKRKPRVLKRAPRE